MFILEFRREEPDSIKIMPEPKDKEVGAGVTWVVNMIGDYVEGEPEGEPPGPGTADQGQTEDPEDGRQFIGVQEEEVLIVEVTVSGLEKFF